jgi:hypothetical protein
VPHVGADKKSNVITYDSVISEAMQHHMLSTHSSRSVLYSAPRDALSLRGLVAALDAPRSKRPRSSQEDLPSAPELECAAASADAGGRVCFKIVFLNPHQKKTIAVPIGAGGGIYQHGPAITIHREALGSEPGGVSLAVEQTASNSHDLQGHWLLSGFANCQRERVETEVL